MSDSKNKIKQFEERQARADYEREGKYDGQK